MRVSARGKDEGEAVVVVDDSAQPDGVRTFGCQHVQFGRQVLPVTAVPLLRQYEEWFTGCKNG